MNPQFWIGMRISGILLTPDRPSGIHFHNLRIAEAYHIVDYAGYGIIIEMDDEHSTWQRCTMKMQDAVRFYANPNNDVLLMDVALSRREQGLTTAPTGPYYET